ncbi:MAG: TIGR00341 family protein [Actinomycetota bacterium]|nr:TIGR00341 family protein [Actinomycetota bacterium]MDD5668023.1 TIGR00341 family protein [Actinomycetota bacterium]
MAKIGDLIHGGSVTSTDVVILEEKLLFDRQPKRDRYVRFFVLLLLSAVIATYGVVSDSVATVIGAMIVAPLMTPIMAISLSVVSGDLHNIVRSFLVVAAGTAAVVGFAYVLAEILVGSVYTAGNSQITARTSPRLIDLIIALASGAAGAFATGREDVSDALPGVAIAVSLVPPLSVVGICLSAGAFREALGALVLFLTNLLAIVIAGLVVFAVMGYGGAALDLRGRKAKRWATLVIILATLMILAPLGVTSHRVTTEQILQQRTKAELEEWLDGTGYEVYRIYVDGRSVDAIVAGEGDLPPFDDLLSGMSERAGDVTINLKVVPERTFQGSTGD